MNSDIFPNQDRDERVKLENLIAKHWRYAKIYLGVHFFSIALFVGYALFVLNSPAVEDAGLAAIPFLMPLIGFTAVFSSIVLFGVVYAISIYVKVKQMGYKETYWPALVVLLISFWPLIIAFFVDNISKLLFA